MATSTKLSNSRETFIYIHKKKTHSGKYFTFSRGWRHDCQTGSCNVEEATVGEKGKLYLDRCKQNTILAHIDVRSGLVAIVTASFISYVDERQFMETVLKEWKGAKTPGNVTDVRVMHSLLIYTHPPLVLSTQTDCTRRNKFVTGSRRNWSTEYIKHPSLWFSGEDHCRYQFWETKESWLYLLHILWVTFDLLRWAWYTMYINIYFISFRQQSSGLHY